MDRIWSFWVDSNTSCIKVAEAAKLMENSQRDINIAFVNEMAMAFNCMGIDTNEVIDAMNTKWNALGFRPGLVGGHCIGVDPYYFVYEAEKLGYHSQIVLSGRKINDGMGAFVADATIKEMVKAGKVARDAKVVILGLTFKENCPDIRNSKVADIIGRLREYDITPVVCDPWVNAQEAKAVKVKHFFQHFGKDFFHIFGKQIFPLFGKHFFQLLGKEFFPLLGKHFFQNCHSNISGCFSL